MEEYVLVDIAGETIMKLFIKIYAKKQNNLVGDQYVVTSLTNWLKIPTVNVDKHWSWMFDCSWFEDDDE